MSWGGIFSLICFRCGAGWRRAAIALSLAAFAAFFSLCLVGDARAALTGSVGTHDPSTIIKDGFRYYDYSTGVGVSMKFSDDLIRWSNGTRVFASPPSWTTAAVPGFVSTMWAPDIIKVGSEYRLYYSVSTFGSQVSAIGLATNTTLNPSGAGYAWVDKGPVIQSQNGSAYNTIDPSVFLDDNNRMWMTFGSYWNGIYITEFDPMTGLRITPTSQTVRIAQNVPTTQIEASALEKHDGHYYLFVDWGVCCQGVDSTYNIRVGRSKTVTGPFLDRNGVAMAKGGGTLLLGTESNFIGPGHFGLFEENGINYMSYHYYDGNARGISKLNIRQLGWTPDAWPVLIPEPGVGAFLAVVAMVEARRRRRTARR
jgi:arabinan endo-1,5-alpha-L-arabinosidase